jgi:hypothetical protein
MQTQRDASQAGTDSGAAARDGRTLDAAVRELGRLFLRSASTPMSLRRDADKWGRRRMAGISPSVAVYV